MLSDARKLVGANTTTKSLNLTRTYGQLDVTAIDYLFGNKGEYKSLQAIAHDFVKSVNVLIFHEGGTEPIVSPWAAAAPEPTADVAEKPADCGRRMQDFSSDGKLADPTTLLLERGFDIGKNVVAKGTDTFFKITKISSESVTVLKQNRVVGKVAPDPVVVEFAEFLGGWEICNPDAAPSELVDWAKATYLRSIFAHQTIVKGAVAEALFETARDENSAGLDEVLRLTEKPRKTVRTKVGFTTGSLKLVPTTTSIGVVVVPQRIPAGAISLGPLLKTGEHTFEFYLQSSYQKPSGTSVGFVEPYWFVRESDDDRECNMVLQPIGVAETLEDPTEVTVEIPLMVNSKEINKYDELVL